MDTNTQQPASVTVQRAQGQNPKPHVDPALFTAAYRIAVVGLLAYIAFFGMKNVGGYVGTNLGSTVQQVEVMEVHGWVDANARVNGEVDVRVRN